MKGSTQDSTLNTVHDSDNRDDIQDEQHHIPSDMSPGYEFSQNVTPNSEPQDGHLAPDTHDSIRITVRQFLQTWRGLGLQDMEAVNKMKVLPVVHTMKHWERCQHGREKRKAVQILLCGRKRLRG